MEDVYDLVMIGAGRPEFSAPLCQAALRDAACESATRLL